MVDSKFTFGQTFHCLLCDGVGAGSVIAYMSKTYSDWLGRQIVLQIETGESLVPLRGLVVNESNNTLRFRLDGGWEVDIYKEMILRVEADNHEAFQPRNWEAGHKVPDAARADSMVTLRWNRVFDRWWSKHFSWQLPWKNILSAGLAGSVLFVLALHTTMPGPIAIEAGVGVGTVYRFARTVPKFRKRFSESMPVQLPDR